MSDRATARAAARPDQAVRGRATARAPGRATGRAPRRAPRAALAALLVVALAGACQPQRRDDPPRVITETRFLEELSDAIAAMNRARAAVVADANALSAGAAALDDVDDVAVDGDRDAARGRRAKAQAAMAKARPAARRLGGHVRAYRRAIDTLARASKVGLDPAQHAAITNVVSAARAEYSPLRDYATVIATIWPRYEKLDEDQRLWLTRYNGGWYRDRQEAAGAYVVMTDRDALARDRRSLAGADKRRIEAARAYDAEADRARGVLATLLG